MYRPVMRIYRLFPDEIGSLEDPLLHPYAKIDHEIDHSALLQNEDASDEVNNPGVLCVIWGVLCEGPFISLLMSPPPTHIVLQSDEVHHESLKHYLCTSVSYLCVSKSSKEASHLYAWLIGFLSTQPPTSPLRALRLDFVDDVQLLTQFMNVLAAPSCRVLHLELSSWDEICFNCILKCLPEIRCLSISLISNLDYFRHSSVDNIHLPPTLVQLRIYCRGGPRHQSTDVIISRVCEMLENETCKLKRLDLDVKPIGAQQMKALMQCVASSSCFVKDLGINLGVNLVDNLGIKVGVNLVQAFTEHNSLSKLKVLRFHEVNTDEAAQCVVKILAIPHCKVRFLDIKFRMNRDPGIMSSNTFFSELRRVEARIECLRAEFGFPKIEEWCNGLADFVGWEDCPLLWLHIAPYDSEDEDAKASELHLANALQVNYRLLFLRLGWRSDAARSRATAFLERNQLYKAAGLNSKQELAKPQVARLFLCGHGEVGKTTIRKALLNLNNRPSTSSSMLSQATTCINRALPCCTSEAQPEPRTRGLEIHQLCFHEGHEKLVIFDLAGQPDYHVFHHYFMNNTNNDLFMVVCKYVTGSTDDAELVSQMQYWLRFIVSHRNTVHGPNPKVMLVLNFFPPINPDINMLSTADDVTRQLRTDYADVLDFGTPGTSDQDFFGINARNTNEIKPILTRLGVLLTSLLKDRPMIPKLSLDLVTSILPQLINSKYEKKLMCGIFSSPLQKSIVAAMLCRKSPTKKVNIVAFEQVKEYYFQQQQQQGLMSEGQKSMLEKRIQVSLIELHNIGDVIFFPPTRSKALPEVSRSAMDAPADIASSSDILPLDPRRSVEVMLPIITDPGWFCNKVVGNLLAPEDPEFEGRFEMAEKKVRQIIRENGCPNEFLNEMMRYVKGAELCYVVEHYDGHGQNQTHFFFPAVSRNRQLKWPPAFDEKRSCDMHFYGRRLKCRDTEKHLIPSGVFARLQVQLLGFCGEGNKRSYRMGYEWVSFVKDSIGVMVRFGGDSDDHPEWIDILVCGEADSDLRTDAGELAMSTEDGIMDGVKHLIFGICQATSRGIPTVVLEEWVLRDKVLSDDVISLTEVEKRIRAAGLHSTVAWHSQVSTPCMKLLLPMDLQKRIMQQVQAVTEIQAEFAVSDDHIYMDENEVVPLTGEFKQLYDALNHTLKAEFGKVNKLLEEIKSDVHKLRDGLRQMEINIVANCSTQLLEQVLAFKDGKLPAYPYLSTATDGKLEKLKAFLLLKKARVHFLCESWEGMHRVEGHAGKEVVVDAGVLMKAAPILVPALRVMCCAAKFAINLYLPGVAPPGLFESFLDCLKPLGINSSDLQFSQIMPKAMDALLDGISYEAQQLANTKPKEGMLKMDEQAFRVAAEALHSILGQKEDLNMEKDFGLHWIQHNKKHYWVCEKHAMGHQKLVHPQNPFSS